MKNSLEKIYKNLTNKQRAELAFQYIVDGDEIEFRRVEESVPVKIYRCKIHDIEYEGFCDGLRHLAMVYGLEHWQQFSALGWADSACHRANNKMNFEKANFYFEMMRKLDAQLLSFDVALENICKEYDFDSTVVRKFSGILEPYAGCFPQPILDIQYQTEREEIFRMALVHSLYKA